MNHFQVPPEVYYGFRPGNSHIWNNGNFPSPLARPFTSGYSQYMGYTPPLAATIPTQPRKRFGFRSVLVGLLGLATLGGLTAGLLAYKRKSIENDSSKAQTPPTSGHLNNLQGPKMTLMNRIAAAFTQTSDDPVLYNFHQVDQHVFRGAMPDSAEAFDQLKTKHGITTVIDLRGVDTTAAEHIEFEREWCKEKGLQYVHIPMNSHQAPTPAELRRLLDTIQNTADQNGRAYIHCKHGVDRTGVMVAAHEVKQGKSPKEAYKAMQAAGYNWQHAWSRPAQKDFVLGGGLNKALREIQAGDSSESKSSESDAPITRSSLSNGSSTSLTLAPQTPPALFRQLFGDNLNAITFRQGAHNTCYLLSALDSIFHHPRGREIIDKINIQSPKPGEYLVKFPGQARPIQVLESELGKRGDVSSPHKGVQLLETAYLKSPGVRVGDFDQPTAALERIFGWRANQTESISLHQDSALRQFIGGVEFPYSERKKQFQAYLQDYQNQHDQTDVDVMSAKPTDGTAHYYSVRLGQSTPEHIVLTDPFNTGRIRRMPIEDFLEQYHIEGVRIPVSPPPSP